MSDFNDITKLDDALDYLNEFAPSLYTNVLNIGKPSITNEIETAGVGVLEDKNEIEFLLGTKMLSQIDHEQLATVLVHESMHVLLNHIYAYNTFADQETVSKAMDAVINDFLIKNNFSMPQGEYSGYSGINNLGMDCSNMTISEVIEIIEAEEGGGGGGDDDNEDQNGEQQRGSGGGFDQHEWMNMSEDQMEKMQEIVDGKSDSSDMDVPQELDNNKEDPDDHDQSVGRGLEGNSAREIMHSGINVKWVDLLREIDPDIIPEPSYMRQNVASWNRVSRKIAGYYPDILLPTFENTHDREGWGNVKPSIVLCLDTSGSVSQADCAMFMAMAQSIPRDRVDLKLYGYASRAYKIDIDKPKIYSGGTVFSNCFDLIISDHCYGDPSQFPKACIVVTDMQDSFTSHIGYGQKVDMNKVIDEYNLKDNFFVMHNYSSNNNNSYYGKAAQKIAHPEKIKSMYEFIDKATLNKLVATGPKIQRG